MSWLAVLSWICLSICTDGGIKRQDNPLPRRCSEWRHLASRRCRAGSAQWRWRVVGKHLATAQVTGGWVGSGARWKVMMSMLLFLTWRRYKEMAMLQVVSSWLSKKTLVAPIELRTLWCEGPSVMISLQTTWSCVLIHLLVIDHSCTYKKNCFFVIVWSLPKLNSEQITCLGNLKLFFLRRLTSKIYLDSWQQTDLVTITQVIKSISSPLEFWFTWNVLLVKGFVVHNQRTVCTQRKKTGLAAIRVT